MVRFILFGVGDALYLCKKGSFFLGECELSGGLLGNPFPAVGLCSLGFRLPALPSIPRTFQEPVSAII